MQRTDRKRKRCSLEKLDPTGTLAGKKKKANLCSPQASKLEYLGEFDDEDTVTGTTTSALDAPLSSTAPAPASTSPQASLDEAASPPAHVILRKHYRVSADALAEINGADSYGSGAGSTAGRGRKGGSRDGTRSSHSAGAGGTWTCTECFVLNVAAAEFCDQCAADKPGAHVVDV